MANGSAYSTQGPTSFSPSAQAQKKLNPNYGKVTGVLAPPIKAFEKEPTILNPKGVPTAAGNAQAQQGAYYQGLQQSGNTSQQQAGQIGMAQKPTTGLLPPQKPQTGLEQFGSGNKDVKSQTTNADGTTKTDFYSDQKTETKTPSTTQAITPPNQSAPQTPPQSTQGQILGNIQQAGQATPMEKEYIDRIQKAQAMQNAKIPGSYAEAGLYKDSSPEQLSDALLQAPDLAGRAGASKGLYDAFSNLYGSQATQGLLAANTIAGRNLTAQTTAGQLNAPVTQFGQLTNPISGAVVGAGQTGNNPALESAVQNAVQMVQNGTIPSDAMASLSGYGQAGVNAFNQAMQQVQNGTYNPSAQNAIAGSNISQGVDYKKAAVDLDTSIKQLDTASSLATNFLTANKLLNPTDNPHLNDSINSYISTFKDPAAVAQYNAILGDIKKFTSTILASNNGTIPTDVTNTLASFDPAKLSAPQLAPYLAGLAQLGNNQKSVIQGQLNSLIPNQPNNYSGSPTNVSTTPIPTPKSTSTVGSKVDNPYAQAGVGTLMNLIGGIKGAITGLASKILN